MIDDKEGEERMTMRPVSRMNDGPPRYQVWLLLFMILGGGALVATLTQEPQHVVLGETVNIHQVDQPFLPMYMDMISGKTKPADTCEVHTLEELLMPCETNRP